MKTCQVIIDAGSSAQQRAFYAAGPSLIGLAGIYLEWNDLETAEDYLTRGIEMCRQRGMDGLYTGYTVLARLHQARGDFEQALAVLRRLEQAFQRWDFFLIIRQVSVYLTMDDIASASGLVAPLLEILGHSSYSQQLPLIATEAFKLSLARIYIAQGEMARAKQMLDDVQATVEPGKRWGRLMEVHLLRGLALQKQHDGTITADALSHLEHALELAEPAGFVLLLLEEGPALIPLLKAVFDHQTASTRAKTTARKLLDTFAGKESLARQPLLGEAPGLIEALTPREMEVLQLVATGDSNQAIAEALFITVRTVKKHTTNILGKLGASNRTQAVARARELGLITSD